MADGDRVDMEIATSPSSETAGDAGTIGRHFARKGETADSPVAGDRVGSRKGPDVETASCPEAPPVPLRAAGTDDGGPDVKSGRETVGDTGGAVPAREVGQPAESRTEARERRRERLGRAGEAKPAPEAPPEKYYPHGRPPRETAGHAKSAAARTAKDRGKKKKPPTGKDSS